MNRLPLVSIVVPVYNTELYLKRCIDSLLAQTYTSIEILLVNDGSTDSSQNIIEAYTSEKIQAFTKENGGLSDARNYGISKSKGMYVAFVDSDDWVSVDFIEKMVFLAEKHAAEMVICNLQKVDEDGIPFNQLTQIAHLPEKIDLNEDFTLFGEISCFACNKLFRKELFASIEFTKSIHFEDIATIPRLLFLCNVVAKTDDFLYHYFERRGSISQSFTEKGLDLYKAIEIIKEDFFLSKYKTKVQEWKRFVIIQGFYSAGAYLARIKNSDLKSIFYANMNKCLQTEGISRKEIKTYMRSDKRYLNELSLPKRVFYSLLLYVPKIIIR